MLYPNLAGTKFDIDVLPQSPRPHGSTTAGIGLEGSIGRARDFRRRAGVGCVEHSNWTSPVVQIGDRDLDACTVHSFPRIVHRRWGLQHHCNMVMDRGATVWPRREQSAIDEP